MAIKGNIRGRCVKSFTLECAIPDCGVQYTTYDQHGDITKGEATKDAREFGWRDRAGIGWCCPAHSGKKVTK